LHKDKLMRTVQSPEYSRNYGFWNEAEQQALLDAKVAIAGVGGDGFQMGLKLAKMGVQTFDIADPEVFEPENNNRVPGATTSTYGRPKVEVFTEQVLDINPAADIRVYRDGVTEDNVEEFMSRADLVFDESELTYPHIGTAIAREARKRNIPDVMVMNVGFAAQVTSFDPRHRFTFERFMGIPQDMPLADVKDLAVDFSRCLPYIPKYGDLTTLQAVQEGASLPSIAPGVDVASAIGSSQAFLHIVQKAKNNRPSPIWAPRILYMDAYSGIANVTKHPQASYYRHLVGMLVGNVLNKYPHASYSADQRSTRERATGAPIN
jgi:molybdopterin/thiamine biosynthesis adenylyltransferase